MTDPWLRQIVDSVLALRYAARKAHLFALSDAMRDAMESSGLILRDKGAGVVEWRAVQPEKVPVVGLLNAIADAVQQHKSRFLQSRPSNKTLHDKQQDPRQAFQKVVLSMEEARAGGRAGNFDQAKWAVLRAAQAITSID